jgi:dihydroxy-acid dehydratase
MAGSGLTLDKIMTGQAIENAIRVLLAIGGSTNGLIHITAMAGRLGIEVSLERVDELARETPVIVDLKPSGEYYMQELHEAGGFATIMRTLAPLLDLEQITVSGESHKQILDAANQWPQTIVRPLDNPLSPEGGLSVLRGNLAPDGAVIKQSATSDALRTHTGRAIVFESVQDMATRIDDPDLDVTKDDILVMRNAGPVGAPGMPEAGYLPIPKKLAQAGVKDMVRISDARMSGTAFGSIVLHITPEAAIGGPLSLIETGDMITLDIPGRQLNVDLSDEALRQRAAARDKNPPRVTPGRGYAKLFNDTILQADKGCDFDFLVKK